MENVSSYAEFHVSEMTEWEFLSEVVERADCGILLDVNNIYVSSQNHDFDPLRLSQQRSRRARGQIHIAGHSKFEKYILDTHDHPVLDPVWAVVRPRHPPDAARPPRCSSGTTAFRRFDEVHHEALKANRYLSQPELLLPHAPVWRPEAELLMEGA